MFKRNPDNGLILLALLGMGVGYLLWQDKQKVNPTTITSYQQCENAGGVWAIGVGPDPKWNGQPYYQCFINSGTSDYTMVGHTLAQPNYPPPLPTGKVPGIEGGIRK